MSKIKKPFELKLQPLVKVLIYGQPGIGKTTVALSAPSPLILDFDNGIHRVNTLHQTDTVPIEKWEDVLEVLEEDLTAYKTLIIDTAGKMLDYVSDYMIRQNPKYKRGDGQLTQQGFGARKLAFKSFFLKISQLQKHLVFVAHDKEEKDSDSKFIRPDVGGSSGADLIKEIDLVGYMEAIGKKRTISFDPCEKYYGKNTCQLPSLIELQELTPGTPNIFLTEVLVQYEKGLEGRRAMAEQYTELMETIREKVDSIVDAETANEVTEWAGNYTGHIWDSKIQAGYLLRSKAEELGLKLNKSKKYEPADKAA
jgi:hypothetical protein